MRQSEGIRNTSAESDCLHYGMGWSEDDLSKPHVLIQSAYGDSHPGSSHLLTLSGHVRDGVIEAGGRPCIFVATDMCDGIAQGSLGNNYSLLSRDYIASMIEIQARSTMCDGIVLLASCDKSLPAHLMAAARLKIPTIVVPGGSMSAGAAFACCDHMWDIRRKEKQKQYPKGYFDDVSKVACPSAGACQQFGTAGTMQAMAEALGLSLPGTAVLPSANNAIFRESRRAGKQILNLMKIGLTAGDILDKRAFENAIAVHAAIGGSANAIVHLMAIAKEAGVALTLNDFDRIHRQTPYLTNTLSTGKYPTEYFWYAGGVPALMDEIRDSLHLDAMTVTGETLGENLKRWKNEKRSEQQRAYLSNYNVHFRDVIFSRETPRTVDGGIAVLHGNIAAGGAIVKHSAVRQEMMCFQGKAHVFNDENDAIRSLLAGEIKPGELIAVIGQGPRANGMPELFRLGDIIAMDEELSRSVAVITDGRYSGCTRGPAIGYICPEAAVGGAIGCLKTGDTVRVDIPNRRIDLIEGYDENGSLCDGDRLIAARKCTYCFKKPSGTSVFDVYRSIAGQALDGGIMEIKQAEG